MVVVARDDERLVRALGYGSTEAHRAVSVRVRPQVTDEHARARVVLDKGDRERRVRGHMVELDRSDDPGMRLVHGDVPDLVVRIGRSVRTVVAGIAVNGCRAAVTKRLPGSDARHRRSDHEQDGNTFHSYPLCATRVFTNRAISKRETDSTRASANLRTQ